MAGHSHWAGIKYKKAAADAKRGKVFSKLSKALSVAAREGGGNPDDNPKLRMVMEKCRQANMPKDNVERAIKKGTGELAGEELRRVVYEGYGSGGVALMVECITDNANRTFPEVRRIFDSRGAKLGKSGSVAYMFRPKGLVSVKKEAADEDALLEIALEAGADDLSDAGSVWEIICPPDELQGLKAALAAAELEPEIAEVTFIADAELEPGTEIQEKNLRLMAALEDHEDVENVYANFTPSEEAVEHVAGEQ